MLRDVEWIVHYTDYHKTKKRSCSRCRRETVLRELRDLLQRRHEQRLGARQPVLVHEALMLALRMDETDLDLMPVTSAEHSRTDHEETHLMFMANQGPPRVRAQRLRRLLRAVQAQVGSESRHLRRMGVILHGLQMVGEVGNAHAEVTTEEPWLTEAVDELVMLAGSEMAGISDESRWDSEVLALRRCLAQDRLMPTRDRNDAQDESSSLLSAHPLEEMEDSEDDLADDLHGSMAEDQGGHVPDHARVMRKETVDYVLRQLMQGTTAIDPGEIWLTRPEKFTLRVCRPQPLLHLLTVENTQPWCQDGRTSLGVHVWHCMTGMVCPMEVPMQQY